MRQNAEGHPVFTRARECCIWALAASLLAGLAVAPLAVFGAPGAAGAAGPAGKVRAAAAAEGTAPKAGAEAPKAGPKADEAKPDVTGKLRLGSDKERREAVRKLIYGKGRAKEADIIEALGAEPKADVRVRLHRALGGRGGKDAVETLAAGLALDPSPLVRASAAQELGRLRGGKAAVDALARGLARDPHPDVREACAAALASYRSKGAVKALIEAASDPDPGIRLHAALALTRRPKSPEIDEALDKLEQDPDPKVAAKTRAWREGMKAK